MTFIKDVSANADAGTATKWGGNDIDVVDNYFDDIDVSASIVNGTGRARINTVTTFRSSKLTLRDSGNAFNYVFVTSALAASRNITIPVLAANDTLVFLGLAQTFTDQQFIAKDQTDLLTLRRSTSTNGSVWELNFDALDSGAAIQAYCAIRAEINDSTAGAEKGILHLVNTINAVETRCLTIEADGKVVLGGPNRRVRIDETGLTSTRTMTFQDSSYKVAGTNLDNLFSVAQTIKLDTGTLLSLYRDTNTNASGWSIDFLAKDSGSNQTTYAQVFATIQSNTDTTEQALLSFAVMNNGTLQSMARIVNTGELNCGGPNRRVQISESGLTTTRAITFKDASYKVAAENAANTFTGSSQTFQTKVDINKNLHYTGVISPSQITSDQNNYTPTNLLTSVVVRIDCDSSLRSITGLGDTTQTDGQKVVLRNISSANVLLLKDASTNQAASSTAGNRMDFGGYDIPLFPKSSIELIYDGTLSRWVLNDIVEPYIIPQYAWGHYERNDLMHTGNQFHWTSTAASGGTVSNSTNNSIVNHEGLFTFTLGTSTTGFGSLKMPVNSAIMLGNSTYWRFDMVFRLEKLSDATDTYTLRIGFIDADNAESTDGVFFRYTHSVNSGKWVLVTRSNNTESTTNATNTAVATATWYHLTVIVNPAGNVAEFFQDGVSLGTVTTNIPTAASRSTGTGMMFLKSAGTTDSAVITLDTIEHLMYSNVRR